MSEPRSIVHPIEKIVWAALLCFCASIFTLATARASNESAAGSTLTWTGGGADSNWSTPANWSPAVTPNDNVSLAFPAVASRKTNSNDIVGLSLISLSITGGDYAISGLSISLSGGFSFDGTGAGADPSFANAIVLTGAPSFTSSGVRTLTLGGDIALGGSALGVDVTNRFNISGAVSGGGGLTKTGAGTLALGGNNSYTGGTLIAEGTVLVNGTIQNVTMPGPASGTLGGTGTVGTIGSTSGTVAPGASTGILHSGSVTLSATSTFSVEIGGTTSGSGHDQLQVTGTVELGGANLAGTLINGFAPAFGNTFTIIQSTGAITGRFAQGTLVTIGGSRFRVTYNANSVVLTPAIKPWSGLGADNNWSTGANWIGGIAPLAGDDLVFPDGASRLTNNNDLAPGTAFGSLTVTGGDYQIAGNAIGLAAGILANFGSGSKPDFGIDITLNAPQSFVNNGLSVQVAAVNLNGNQLTLDGSGSFSHFLVAGVVSGAGGIVKNGIGNLYFASPTGNTYTGTTQINNGSVEIRHAFGLGASGVGNETIIGPDGALRFGLSDNISVAESLILQGSGFNGPGGPGSIVVLSNGCISGGCTLTGPVVLAGSTIISVSSTRLTINQGITETGVHGLTKIGAGTLNLNGTNAYTAGTEVKGGLLSVNGSIANILVNGGSLGGTGTVGNVTVGGNGGTIVPGASAGVLHTGSLTLTSALGVAIELGGLAAGTQYDQIQASGSVTLGGANLSLSVINGFAPALGDQFTILQATGPISGQFAQGTTVTVSGVRFGIAYNANSVVLTVTGTTSQLSVTTFGSGTGMVTSNDGMISCPSTCSHGYLGGPSVTLTATPLGGSVFTGWLGACTGNNLQCTLTVNANKFVSAVFALPTLGTHILDVDGNGVYDPLTDGLLVVRYLYGHTGPALTANVDHGGGTREVSNVLISYLEDIRPYLDIDGNGNLDPATDGLMVLRYLFGIRGNALTDHAIGNNPTRPLADIEPYLGTLTPP